MDLRRSRPRASREPDAGEAEADKEEDGGDCKSPICGSGNGCVLLGETMLTANLCKTAQSKKYRVHGRRSGKLRWQEWRDEGCNSFGVSPNRAAVANWSWSGNRVQDLARPATGFGFHS